MTRAMPFAALLLVACGGGGDDDEIVADGPLDCEWFADEGNCWAETTANANDACQPPDEDGVLTSDHGSCSFSDGTVITFAQPLDLEGDGPDDWDFTVASPSGSSCRFVSDDDGVALTVDGDTAAQTLDGTDAYMECPDGSIYGPASAFALLECDWSTLPGHSWSNGPTSVSFSLLGEPTLSFSCSEG